MTVAQSPIDFAAPGLSTQPAALNADERATRRLGTYLTLPTQILLAFIVIFPLLMELYISLSSWTPLDGRNWLYAYRYWAGLDNYWELISNARFWQSIGRTLFIMVVCVPVELLLGLGLALLFAGEFRGKRLFYSIMLMPMMVVPAVAGYMFFMLFQSGGPINDILSTLSGGAVSIAWLSRPNLALAAVMIADIWQWTPLMFLILLAGLARRSGGSTADGDAVGGGALVALSPDRAAAHPRHSFDRVGHPYDRNLQGVRHALHHDHRRPGRQHGDDLGLHLQSHDGRFAMVLRRRHRACHLGGAQCARRAGDQALRAGSIESDHGRHHPRKSVQALRHFRGAEGT
jgi:ABC-type spermidine/putrescine transport system permease subunit II